MKDPNFLLSVLSLVWMVTVALFIYIIKAKDATEIGTKNTLAEIKELISTLNISFVTIETDLKNNIYTTRSLYKKVETHTTGLHKIELELVDYQSFKIDMERRILTLENLTKK